MNVEKKAPEKQKEAKNYKDDRNVSWKKYYS